MTTLKILAVFGIAVSIFSSSTTSVAQAPGPSPKTFKEQLVEASIETRRELVKEKINEVAEKYGANASEMYATIARCENKELDPNQQSGHRYNFNAPKRGIVKGEQEQSFGLAMIHLPDHPDISKTEATDPEFALDWMAQEFAKGREQQWTCHTLLFGA